MQYIHNKFRGVGLETINQDVPFPSISAQAVERLLRQCPVHAQTPLVSASKLAAEINVSAIYVKDERTRMGLGSFKALGAAYVIACDADTVGGDLASALQGQTYVTASAGNHGMSVAAGARIFGADAVIFLSQTVPAGFARRLEDKGAKVIVEGDNYEASMKAAMQAADRNGWRLLSDSSWDGYTIAPHRLMEGYLQMAAEAFNQMPDPPTHVILQAGVGGMAGAVAALARDTYGDAPKIIVVEPDAAPALYESIVKGTPVMTRGPVSDMGRLDCKEPSLIALKGLARDADFFALVTEHEGARHMSTFASDGLATTPSGGAGLSFLFACDEKSAFSINEKSRVLAFLSEGPET